MPLADGNLLSNIRTLPPLAIKNLPDRRGPHPLLCLQGCFRRPPQRALPRSVHPPPRPPSSSRGHSDWLGSKRCPPPRFTDKDMKAQRDTATLTRSHSKVVAAVSGLPELHHPDPILSCLRAQGPRSRWARAGLAALGLGGVASAKLPWCQGPRRLTSLTRHLGGLRAGQEGGSAVPPRALGPLSAPGGAGRLSAETQSQTPHSLRARAPTWPGRSETRSSANSRDPFPAGPGTPGGRAPGKCRRSRSKVPAAPGAEASHLEERPLYPTPGSESKQEPPISGQLREGTCGCPAALSGRSIWLFEDAGHSFQTFKPTGL